MSEKLDLDELMWRMTGEHGIGKDSIDMPISEVGALISRIRELESASQPGGGEAVDVHSLLRDAEDQKQARAEQLPTEQDCIRLMIKIRLRLQELEWFPACFAPKDGGSFQAIVAGYAGPSECRWLGSAFFAAEKGDWWPVTPWLVSKRDAAAPSAAPSAGNGGAEKS